MKTRESINTENVIGEPAPKYNPKQLMIEDYKKHIAKTQLKDEVYKWELIDKYKGKPNLEVEDLLQEIKSIDYSNLMYHLSKAVINELAEENPSEIRRLFTELFDESVDLTKRVKAFSKDTKTLYNALGKTNQHHQDERAISAYLTLRYPEKYTFYKHTFYKNYCNLLGIKQAKKNEKYSHYLSLIDELIENYIESNTKLIEQVKGYIPEYYDGVNHKLLAQDILYQMQEKNAGVNYWIFQGNPNIFDFKTALRDEVLTSWTVTAHKDKIKTGDKVILWITGNKSGCYALAEVTSMPQDKNIYPDSHLWRVEDKSDLKADINITHNLVDNPLLRDEIDEVEELSNLKVGNQGTNFSATDKQYKAILELIENSDKFEETKNKFDFEYGTTFFESFIDKLRKIVSELNLQPNDERIVYSVRFNRFNFTIGQRYCFNIHLKYSKGVYGFISTEELRDNIYYYKGTPKAFYNYCNDFNLNSKEWTSMIDAMNIELKRTTKSSFYKNNNKEFEDYVFEDSPQSITRVEETNYPLNTIFYGPPGTGKTYNTVLRAAEIVESRMIESYDEALKIFKEKLHDQIEFITFHQNYSYEDFIQGLRPDVKEENEQLNFKKSDGVFKIIADRALLNSKASEKAPEEVSQINAFTEGLEILKDKILESEEQIKINETAYFTAVEDNAFRYSGDNWTLKDKGFNGFRMKYSDLERFFEEGVTERNEIKDLDNISGLAKQHATYFIKAFELVKSLMPKTINKVEKVEKKNYVIIIDEINRANISRVFGELITLIEPDKRSHGAIPLETRLPSGDPFIVPSNLYIIGTMNTADKSIALLDIALRRRFDFEAMYPLYEIEGQEIHDVDILKKLNEQIIKSKGHDFQIGHAYFMANNKTLTDRMNNKVIPLLLEYYMNDEKEVKGILQTAGLAIEEDKWPLRITGRND